MFPVGSMAMSPSQCVFLCFLLPRHDRHCRTCTRHTAPNQMHARPPAYNARYVAYDTRRNSAGCRRQRATSPFYDRRDESEPRPGIGDMALESRLYEGWRVKKAEDMRTRT